MQRAFPLFNSHLDLAHHFWERVLTKDDTVIDATCGNGKDTLKLAQLLEQKGGGELFAIDIQRQAILKYKKTSRNTPPLFLSHLHLLEMSHEHLPDVSPKLIVYNLGYLPGGDKTITTLSSSTLASFKQALSLIRPGGVISLTCYPGHVEGHKEQDLLIEIAKNLKQNVYSVFFHQWLNRPTSPSLLLIQKINNN